jgi:hypothetical protein
VFYNLNNSKLNHYCEKYQTGKKTITQISNFLCIFSILLESVNVRLFHTTQVYSTFDLIKALKQLDNLKKRNYM